MGTGAPDTQHAPQDVLSPVQHHRRASGNGHGSPCDRCNYPCDRVIFRDPTLPREGRYNRKEPEATTN